ncbi:MAG: hypothetical protein PHQ43_05350 [Dehalococcoidales bacterium]|nr:hypothetical protein [Dehalococcoidales bacterium]
MAKVKTAKKRTKATTKRVKKRAVRDASGGEDRKSARKFRRGGRVEAYTWGEVSGKSSNWPF